MSLPAKWFTLPTSKLEAMLPRLDDDDADAVCEELDKRADGARFIEDAACLGDPWWERR